jgi:hypothetical protein
MRGLAAGQILFKTQLVNSDVALCPADGGIAVFRPSHQTNEELRLPLKMYAIPSPEASTNCQMICSSVHD